MTQGERDADVLARRVEAVLADADVVAEYVAVVDHGFRPVERVEGPARIAVAARVGSTRLIDNIEVAP